ncbi:iron-siderophore ABC transporter substrate-binding protein [Modestobacter sp. NPDC049651]|uniref:iron-siderophore ABC transporter substrate-binding protein n=1 Tax=unclassified Modestobacter TaxID=2643866 RepID=UPI0033E304F1
MRRPSRLAVPLLAVALAAGVSACGGSDDPADAGASGSAGGAFPVSIENKFGTTEVESAPERVVTIGFNDLDFVLALGVTPVGTRANLGYDASQRPWAPASAKGAELPTVGETEIDVEKVAALKPDLIVGVYSFIDQQTYDQLSAIAPTLAQTDEYADGATPWQEQTLLTGKALGREEQAQDLVDDVEAKFEQARADHPEFAGTSVAVDYNGVAGSDHFLMGADDLRSQFFTALGFTVPDASTAVSNEQLGLIDQDVLIGGGFGPTDAVATSPLFTSLAAVQEDRTVYLGAYTDDLMGALGYGSPLALPYLLERVEAALGQAADGDPATKVEQPTA